MQEMCLFTQIALFNIRLPLVHVFFMFGTSYVDTVKGRKLLTGDGTCGRRGAA